MRIVWVMPVLMGLSGCAQLNQAANGITNGVQKVSRQDPAADAQSPKEVYSASECIGTVIMGECHGAILPNASYHAVCHGEMLNGQCTGPMF